MPALWHGSVSDFAARCDEIGHFASLLQDRYQEVIGKVAPPEEVLAWTNSLSAFAVVLRMANIPAVQIAIEYELPLGGGRADVVLFGQNMKGCTTACVVELKQWSDAQPNRSKRYPLRVPGLPTPQRHPLTQAVGYATALAHCHELANTLTFTAAAYLHNMPESGLAWSLLHQGLKDTPKHVDAKLFGKSSSRLGTWLQEQVGCATDTDALMVAFENFLTGEFQHSETFFARVKTLFLELAMGDQPAEAVASSAWKLSPAQGAVVAHVTQAVESGERQAFVITGDPGSGKTVVALNLVRQAVVAKHTALYATGNRGLANVVRETLPFVGTALVKNVKDLRGPNKGTVELLVIDESQRLWEKEGEVDHLAARARVVVFLLSDDQILAPNETGTHAYVMSRLTGAGYRTTHLHLKGHFRCAGGQGYVNFAKELVGLRCTDPQPPIWRRDAYPVRILPTLDSLKVTLRSWLTGGARGGLVSALSQSTATMKGLGQPIFVGDDNGLIQFYLEHGSNHLDRSVSIYTVQGLELDFVGLVWGDDLVWRSGQWIAQPKKSTEGVLRNLSPADALPYLQNRYWVLLTRALKGLAIYCTDPATATYLASRI